MTNENVELKANIHQKARDYFGQFAPSGKDFPKETIQLMADFAANCLLDQLIAEKNSKVSDG